MLEKTLISRMNENGANENPLMLKSFEFIKKMRNFIRCSFHFEVIIYLLPYIICFVCDCFIHILNARWETDGR